LTDVSEVLTSIFIIALMEEAVRSTKTSVNIYQTKRRNVPEGSHLHCIRSWGDHRDGMEMAANRNVSNPAENRTPVLQPAVTLLNDISQLSC
jgi:hypothetical protein